MTTREIILQTLRSTDDFVSGELLSQQCEISRAAVWKDRKSTRLNSSHIH